MNSPSQAASPRVPIANWLVLIFLVAELLRVGTAIWLAHRNRQAEITHEFPDSQLYWKLALNIAEGKPFDDGKRQVLRTPGYPVFLAGCIKLFGYSPTGARHLQAALGSLSCVLLFALVRRLLDNRAALLAGALAAVYPFAIFLSGVLLSESIFTFVLLVQLLCLVHLRSCLKQSWKFGPIAAWSALTGLSGAVATLVRPSWLPVTLLIALWLVVRRRGEKVADQQDTAAQTDAAMPTAERQGMKVQRFDAAFVAVLAFCLGMSPWVIRNWRVTEHWVPTTLWIGASLYDGLNERATGASNMEFMDQPAEWGLDPSLNSMSEWEQDRYLRAEAWKFARAHPWRVVELAGIKFVRFWNPLPNAAEWSSLLIRLGSLATCGPVLVLALIGAWRLRNRPDVIAILAGPVLYFSAVHLVFVSSIRYREAAMLPVLGLVAAALVPKADTSSPS